MKGHNLYNLEIKKIFKKYIDKMIPKYKYMPEEFYTRTKLPVVRPSNVEDFIKAHKSLKIRWQFQEQMSGSGRFSAEIFFKKVSVLLSNGRMKCVSKKRKFYTSNSMPGMMFQDHLCQVSLGHLLEVCGQSAFDFTAVQLLCELRAPLTIPRNDPRGEPESEAWVGAPGG